MREDRPASEATEGKEVNAKSMRLHARSKRTLAIAAFVMIFSMGGAAVAWACTALATLDLNTSSAGVGDQVVATGQGFSWYPTDSPVFIRVNGTDGTLVAETKPDLLNRSFQEGFSVPELPSGSYVVTAEQYDALGDPIAGTPARATLEIE